MHKTLPKALKQILEVAYKTYNYNYDRISSVKSVAKTHRVSSNTITSACTRSINISTQKLDKFLKIKNASKFEHHLIQRFPNYQKQIEEFFNDVLNKNDLNNPGEISGTIKQILPMEKKFLIAKIYFNEIKKNFIHWKDRKDIPEDVKNSINEWLLELPDILG